jgi:hypothetical protein
MCVQLAETGALRLSVSPDRPLQVGLVFVVAIVIKYLLRPQTGHEREACRHSHFRPAERSDKGRYQTASPVAESNPNVTTAAPRASKPSISAILVSEMIRSGAAVSTLLTQLFKETGHFPQPWED